MSDKPADALTNRIIALRPVLLRHATFLIGARTDIGSPEDLVQDTLLISFQHAHRFEEGSLSGWLTAILHNCIRNARRRANRRDLVLSPLGTTSSDDAEMIDVPVDASQETTLELDDVMSALRALSATDREVIWLVRVEGLPQAEVAARLGVQTGTVHSRLWRATTNLRAAYGEAQPAATMHPNNLRRHAA
ncbi:RNA polymerase subunit sigma-24 [Rhodopseudomonas sp. AAP120]|uniref:RNA polymerase sigma factor n=1 Tax=Rhodopseudomonas sp. AAP120 TaxID=1523430 RepID=UPI0006B93C17|nr:RNA polymerase sigma factor [Rhodopseudomonas sp. AAP120]KPF95497.1 RNA polymerase subunit sigma-24 [Rhodopseudomonas sp. AAP120]